ncbi:hypothetical protein JCM9279_005281 [Rhodotorula babjevae]
MVTPRVVQLPRIAVQPSLPLVLDDLSRPESHIAAENAWVSAYDGRTRSAHARIRVSEGEHPGECDLDPLDHLVADLALDPTHCAVRLAVPALGIRPTTALLPSPRLNPLRPASSSSALRNPTSLDKPAPAFLASSSASTALSLVVPSPTSDKLLLAGADGHARVVHLVGGGGAAHDSAPRKGPEVRLRGHVGDVCAAGWAASGEVVVTAASDMTVRVFSAADGSSPRVAAVPPQRPTSLLPLLSPVPRASPSETSAPQQQPHKGRHVLVSSQSGTLTLLDLSPSPPAPLHTWRLPAPVTACAVLLAAPEDEDEDPDDVGRARYALAAARDGTVRLVPLSLAAAAAAAGEQVQGRVLLRAPPASGGITALAALRHGAEREREGGWTVALGTGDGTVAVFDVPRAAVVAAGEQEQEQELEREREQEQAPEGGRELAPRVVWRRTPLESEEGPSAASGAGIHALVLSRRARTCEALEGEGERGAQSVLVAPGDGLAYRAGLRRRPGSATMAGRAGAGAGAGEPEGGGAQEEEEEEEEDERLVHVEEELVGLDCEPARSIAEDAHGRVWVVGGGAVRVYERREL